MPTIEELQARIAAQATQVALLHNALRVAANYIGPPSGLQSHSGYSEEGKAAARVVEAALNTGEGECAKLLDLARRAAGCVLDDRPAENDYYRDARRLMDMIDQLEGKLKG